MLGSWPDDGRGEQRLMLVSVGICNAKDKSFPYDRVRSRDFINAPNLW